METIELGIIENIQPELSVVVRQSGLQKGDIHAIVFAPFMKTVAELSEKLATLNKDNPQAIDVKIARECRLALVKNRTATGKQKDASKSTLLAEGNLIQSLHNVVINKSLLIEADYEAIEKYAEKKEQERQEALRIERTEILSQFNMDITGYDLGVMSDKVFNDIVDSQKALKIQRENEARQLEIERIENEKRIAAEREKVRLENERLKKEAEKKEKELEKVRADARKEAERIAKENEAKLAAIEKENALAREKANKERLQREKELEAQKKENDRIANELREKEIAEANRLAKIKEEERALATAEKKAAKAPDKKKLKLWVEAMSVTTLDLKEAESEAVMNVIISKFDGFKKWAAEQIEKL